MTLSDTSSADAAARRSILQYHRPRGLLAIASAACFAIFWWVGRLMDIPEALYLDPSLATQASPLLNYLIAGVTLIACTLIGTLIAGTVRTDAGFFAACAGMMALAIRFGSVGQAYREASGAGIFLWLAVETALFYGLVAAAWYVQLRLHRLGLSVADQVRDGMAATPMPLPAKLLAAGTHVAAMCLLLLLLLRSDARAQALASIGLASLIASLIAHSLFAITPSAWMWVSPMVVGIIGYGIGMGTPPAMREIGLTRSALAHAIPLDYATAGPAGALIGYWMSRKWHAARQRELAAKQTVIVVPGSSVRG